MITTLDVERVGEEFLVSARLSDGRSHPLIRCCDGASADLVRDLFRLTMVGAELRTLV